MLSRLRLILPLLLLAAMPAQAVDYRSAMETYLQNEIVPWKTDPIIIDAIRAQNARTSGMSPSEIETMDQAWRAEVDTAGAPIITSVLINDTSDFLRGRVSESNGAMTEVFVMDAVGLNVASSHITSDYWQGDEAKHQKTYGMGPDAIHFGEIEFDESSQSYQAQISVTVTDPDTGEAIGAITVGLNADRLI